jgi:hypothetical protein
MTLMPRQPGMRAVMKCAVSAVPSSQEVDPPLGPSA